MRTIWNLGLSAFLLMAIAGAAVAQDEAKWPVELEGDRGSITIYQPQIESFKGNILESRAAISVTPKGGTPVFGACWFEARMSTDMDTRLATLESVKVTAARFPDQDEAKVKLLTDYLEREIPTWNITVSIDQLAADLETDSAPGASQGLNNDPPEVIYTEYPTVLVVIDGDPKLADLEGSNLKYVQNSPFYILGDPTSKTYYLRGGDYWYVSRDIRGEWRVTNDLPASVQQITTQIEAEEARQRAEKGEDAPSEAVPEELGDSPTPKVIVRTGPAELLETDGEPKFAPIEGTNLLYMENTESDILMDITTQEYYILISGRWYKSTSMTDNQWTFVSNDQLPADFAKIPEDSDMSQVLVSVSGTEQAKEAVLENSIPQTAEIDRKTATVDVKYDGDPQFEKCGDAVAYAINTDKSVLLVNNRYYCCDEAVWFASNQPDGPWQVATSVPNEIQDIPPDCPAYNVKYVYVYDSTPEVVYVGYTPAYYGSYVHAGCIVYGTGWYYRPWWGPVWYPRPTTWGFHVHWNPVTGWGFSYGVSFGWLHITVGRPWYGGWWGPAGYRQGYRHGYHRGYYHGYHRGARAGFHAGYYAGKQQANRNAYKHRSNGVRRTGTTQAANRKQPRASTRPNNVYADKKGNVYRQQGGNWQTRDNKNNSWQKSSGKPSTSNNKSAQARDRSNQRSQHNRSATQNRSAQSRGRGGGGKKR